MSNLMPNEDTRAHLLASLEYGVSPLMPADLYGADDEDGDDS